MNLVLKLAQIMRVWSWYSKTGKKYPQMLLNIIYVWWDCGWFLFSLFFAANNNKLHGSKMQEKRMTKSEVGSWDVYYGGRGKDVLPALFFQLLEQCLTALLSSMFHSLFSF